MRPSSPSALRSTRAGRVRLAKRRRNSVNSINSVNSVNSRRRAHPQGTARPSQTEGNQSRQAEFVICEQSIERGFAFLKDPLFLASSVFVKKPQRIVACSLVMVLCPLVYRLAEHRLRERLAATGQTVPSQVKQPTDRPTLRWMFHCFDGTSLVRFLPPHGSPQHDIAGVEPFHEQVIRVLGPCYEKRYKRSA